MVQFSYKSTCRQLVAVLVAVAVLCGLSVQVASAKYGLHTVNSERTPLRKATSFELVESVKQHQQSKLRNFLATKRGKGIAVLLSAIGVGALVGVPVAVAKALKDGNTPQDGLAVAYYVRTYKVSEAEARRRLALQVKVENLEAVLIKVFGDGITRVWFDNQAGNWVIAISSKAIEAQVRAELERLGLQGSSIVTTSYNHEDLKRTMNNLNGQLAKYIESGKASVGVGVEGLLVTLAASVTAGEQTEVQSIIRNQLVPVKVIGSDQSSLGLVADTSCSKRYCDRFMGGTKWSQSLPSEGFCTTGFYVKSLVDYHPFLLTAGHCVKKHAGQRWKTCWPAGRCRTSGSVVGGYFGGGGGDAGLLRVDSTWLAPSPQWINWWNNNVSTVTGFSAAPPGTVLCHQGAVSGSSCGTVTINPATTIASYQENGGEKTTTLTNMIEIQGACNEPGDSGGPWTFADQTWAAGINSAANDEGTFPSQCGLRKSYAEPVSNALSTLGVYLVTGG